MTWQPMDTAPRDGTLVDLWVIRSWIGNRQQKQEGYRHTDCWWGQPDGDYFAKSSDPKPSPQWVYEDEVHQTAWKSEVEYQINDDKAVVTHWMPRPEPPE